MTAFDTLKIMNRKGLSKTAGALAVLLPHLAFADLSDVRTNYVEKFTTNTVEIRIPRNLFVTEYETNVVDFHTTNLVTIYSTNVVESFKTNWTTRYLTNEIAVHRIRTNSVDVYKTNWTGKTMTNLMLVSQVQTNVVDVFKTNWTVKRLTNEIAVELVDTNFVDAYKTNWITRDVTNEMAIDLIETNFVEAYTTNWTQKLLTNEIVVNLIQTNTVDRYQTNWMAKHLTNEIVLNLVQTNLVDRYRTNWKTLNLTNWQNVLVMKTNWVTQPITNIVFLDLPAPQSAQSSLGQGDPSAQSSGELAEPPTIEAARTFRPSVNNVYEVSLKIRWTTPAPQQVQHWWIARQDGAYLSVGQDREFRRELPAGTYRIEAKVQREPDSAVVILRGSMVVTPRDVVVTPGPSGKLAAN